MFHAFFDEPGGNGSALKLYMLSPRRLLHALNLLIYDRKYFVLRIRVIFDQLLHPNDPWLTRTSISFLHRYLRKDMEGFEFGSGRSTKWFAKRVSHLVSIEDNLLWYHRLKPHVTSLKVDYRFVETASGCRKYVDQLASFPDDTFDFILIDGSCRDSCVSASPSKVKPGGIIILDNADEVRDIQPLDGFARHSTGNGIWKTDIFIRLA